MQSGGHGASVVKQSGAFSVASGRSARSATATFGGDPGDYDAELILTGDGSHVSCCRADRGQTDL